MVLWYRISGIQTLSTQVPEPYEYRNFNTMVCCEFRPAFGCCAHPKACRTTFFQPFSTFFVHFKPFSVTSPVFGSLYDVQVTQTILWANKIIMGVLFQAVWNFFGAGSWFYWRIQHIQITLWLGQLTIWEKLHNHKKSIVSSISSFCTVYLSLFRFL